MNGSMLYYARFDYAIFIESAWLLDPNALGLKGNWPGL